MTSVRWTASLLALSLTLTACGSSSPPASSSSSDSSQSTPSGVKSDRIIVSELSPSADGLSVYAIVNRYKSEWLQQRGSTSFNNPNPIQVYLDNTGSPYGTVEVLRKIRAVNVSTIRYFNAREAHFQFGLGNVSGAILVETKDGGE